ncbi:MAG TPA: tRNA (N6-isopentenyl adenosine(37)-C2)-methylthiotransferase MiaB [Actinomycetota bacterium]|nr:tRNA (N6-isopentenyl adenosine(37)-C2)-methylthiotransferase MiaB [Actinomycetota bacterium]
MSRVRLPVAAGGPAPAPAPDRGRRYFLQSFGCQMNEHDAERMAGLMEVAGYNRVERAEDAHVAIFNTCAIRENADNRLYGHLGRLRPVKDRTGIRIAVGGCQAEKDREAILDRAPWVDVVFGTRNIDRLPALLATVEEAGVPIVELAESFEVFPSALPARRGSAFHAWVAIQYGCNNSCTFCIVPHVRGAEISRPVGEIVGEVRRLSEQGITEISLLGQNVNSYGRDLTGRPIFSTLLRELDSVEGIRRIRFTSPHPKDFKEDTARAMAECPSVCEHLHFPLQSGSDAVLRRMKRAYSRATYLEKVAMAREVVPGLALTTDIIVGFPGETGEEFEDTLSLVEEVRYDSAYMFQYSSRPHTAAAEMDGQLPREVVGERFDRLLALQERISLELNEREVGCVVEVTVESERSKRDAARATGRTRTNKLVHLDAQGLRSGDVVHARVTGARTHYLLASPA